MNISYIFWNDHNIFFENCLWSPFNQDIIELFKNEAIESDESWEDLLEFERINEDN